MHAAVGNRRELLCGWARRTALAGIAAVGGILAWRRGRGGGPCPAPFDCQHCAAAERCKARASGSQAGEALSHD